MKKILILSLWLILIAGLLFTVGFATRREDRGNCSEFVITIHRDGENYFVEEDHIRELLESTEPMVGRPIGSIRIDEIERLVNTNPWIARAEVYMGIEGKLKVEIWQKRALARVINSRGESYYIDDKGGLMVWSAEFSPRVLLINGNIPETFNRWYNTPLIGSLTTDSVKNLTILDELFFLSNYIRSDTLWNAQFEQVYVNSLNEFELIPKIGEHRILFGDTINMKIKFDKLALFYTEGLNHTGWNQYDTLNLKFDNQVVCSKIK